MGEVRSILERGVGGVVARPDPFERMLRRRDRKRRRRRVTAGAVGVAIALAGVIVAGRIGLLRSQEDDLGGPPRFGNGPLTVFSDTGRGVLPFDGYLPRVVRRSHWLDAAGGDAASYWMPPGRPTAPAWPTPTAVPACPGSRRATSGSG